ncbi:hypothetical protein O6B97_04165 [Campylobacter ureolyticus]|uniref:coiled-coil domain-containing protein n=2 Tax=Campylobacter ureolyticus TaxID=827 RepID=UPI0022B4BAFA|nr:hypothetical protein [Campylobacter ureolyticus]MCZ6186288.1 hypothetical protein [Campylobacter ureolyticus]
MKPIFKFISIFFILLNFNLFADCTKFSNVGLKEEILKVDYPELYKKYNLSGKDFIFIKDNEWFKAIYYSSSQGFDVMNTHLCGENDRSFDEDSFYISGPTMYYIVSFLGNLDSGGKPNPKYNAYSYEFYKIESISNPCQKNEVFNPETKQCETCPEGFFLDPYSKTCESKQERPKWCPEPMIYKERQGNWKTDGHRTIKECLPDPNINEDECKQRGMKYHGPCADLYGVELNACLKYPTGCYANETSKHFGAQEQLDNDLFSLSGFMFPLPIDAIKNGWNALSNFMKSLFKSPNPKTPNPNLLEYRPQIVDMRATKNGPEPIFDLRAVKDNDIFTNHIFKNTGKTDINKIKDIPTTVDKTPQKIVDISPNFKKFDFPNDGSVSKMQNNQLVAAKMKYLSKPIPTKEITMPNVNKEISLNYDLNSMLKDNPTKNLPMVIKQTSKNGNKTNYKGVITTPDNSVVNVKIIETDASNGSKVQDIDLSFDYDTPSGKKKFNTGYVITIDNSGKVVNNIYKPSTVTDPSTGKTNLNNNNQTPAPTNNPDLSSLENAINRTNSKLDSIDNKLSNTNSKLDNISNKLDRTNSKLDDINKNVSDIKAEQKAQWEYKPNIDTATSFSALKTAMSNLDVSINDAFNFLNGVKDDINSLMNDFDNALDVFKGGIDEPKIPNGICPFKISGPAPGSGKTNIFEIDPCRLVSPYKSILTIFFTFWFSFEIIMFSLKYLFKVGGNS